MATAPNPVSSQSGGFVLPPGQGVPAVQGFRDTPKLLSRHGNLLAGLLLALTVFGIAWYANVRANLTDAREAADQVLLTQQAQVRLTRADALATSAFLQGGLQADDALKKFNIDTQSAATDIAAIRSGVNGRPAERSLTGLAAYLTDVSAARENNRQGFPVGATYQKAASKLMAETVLKPLRQVNTSAREQLASKVQGVGSASTVPVVLLLLGGLGLLIASRFLSKQSNRTVNQGVAAAALVFLAGVGLASSAAATVRRDTVNEVRARFREADLYSQAQVALNAARSAEALTLIARGSGQSYEAQWQQSAADADAALREARRTFGGEVPLSDYLAAHKTVRKLDDSGDWDAARLQALPPSGKAWLGYQGADMWLTTAIDANLSRGGFLNHSGLVRAQIILAIGGLVAAALARAGFQQRIREYR
jgi:hypothetical protein